MQAELRALTSGDVAEVGIENLEEDYTLTLTRRTTGSATVKGRINPRSSDFVTLEFSFDSDLGSLDGTTRERARLCAD